MARTERESDSRRREEKWQTCWCCRDQQRACRMAQVSAEKLEQTGPAEKEQSRQSRALDRKEGIQCQRSKESSSSRGKRKRLVFLCKRTVKVKVKRKVIPTSFLKIEGRGCFLGRKTEERGRFVELVGNQNPGPKAPPRSKRRGRKRDVRRGTTARGVMDKSRYLRVIVEVRGDDPIEYFPRGSEVPFESQRR